MWWTAILTGILQHSIGGRIKKYYLLKNSVEPVMLQRLQIPHKSTNRTENESLKNISISMPEGSRRFALIHTYNEYIHTHIHISSSHNHKKIHATVVQPDYIPAFRYVCRYFWSIIPPSILYRYCI